jgi:hypothetical protein
VFSHNSVSVFEPSVSPNFNFLLDPQPTPTPSIEPPLDPSWCKLCGRQCQVPRHRAYGLAWGDREISAWTKSFGVEASKAFHEEDWQGLESIPCPANHVPLSPRADRTPLFRTSTSTFEFFSDLNTPLPGPWSEPIQFRYFRHTADCPNPISPDDLRDKYDRPQRVRACPHCRGLLRKSESPKPEWTTPIHWDPRTQEVFAARPIPKARLYPARRRMTWITHPIVEDGVRKVAGHWEEWLDPTLKAWTRDQKTYGVDQNYFRTQRLQRGFLLSTAQQTGYVSRVEIDQSIANGMKLNTLRQRAIRKSRKARTDAKYASDDIPLLSCYVDKMSKDVDPLCEGGCFALVPFNRRLELKRLGPYDTPGEEVFKRLDEERKASVCNGVKLARRKARRSNLDASEATVQNAKARIESAFEQCAIFRRRYCEEHGS